MTEKPTDDSDSRPSDPDENRGVHETPQKALEKVGSEFEYWSGKLTETSLQMCYALVAGNWLVFGSVGSILGSGWAMLSLLMVLLAMILNMVGAYIMSEWMRLRFEYAESDSDRWKEEFKEYSGERNARPFTKGIEMAGIALRVIKVGLPLVGGLFLIVGAMLK